MYKVNRKERCVQKIKESSFTDLGLQERYDIQEWIANYPDMLEYTDKLLIIQKEFDGFEDTNRRLDLLALDDKGNIVVIENKRDDTGVDVTWQAINYASFCSTLTKQQVIDIYNKYLAKQGKGQDAEQIIEDFLLDSSKGYPSDKQKIILVSHHFRSEVLSAVQWLNSNGLDITCIRLRPYKFQNEIIVDTDRILPQDALKDYTLKLSSKTADLKSQEVIKTKAIERNLKFWKAFNEYYDTSDTIFKNVASWNENKESWKGASAGFGKSLSFNFVILNDRSRVELYLDNAKQDYNKKVFDFYYSKKQEIEGLLVPHTLTWERLDERRASRISIQNTELKPSEEENWQEIFKWLKETMNELINVLSRYKIEVNKI